MTHRRLILPFLLACTPPEDDVTPDTDSDAGNAWCDGLGFDTKPFDPSAAEVVYDAVVPDLQWPTLDGTFTLSEHWTGCDAFVIVPIDAPFRSEDLLPLFEDADPNTVFLFASSAPEKADAVEDLTAFREDIDAVLKDLSRADRRHWRDRVHHIATGTNNRDLGAIVDGLGPADLAGIDQFQRLRRGGSLAVAGSDGQWLPMLTHARYTAQGYHHEARLTERFAREEAELGDALLVLDLMTDTWSEDTFDEGDVLGIVELELPPAAELARYDRLEVVMQEMCAASDFPHHGESCSGEVGRSISVCEDDCTDDDRHEFFKIISGYNTGGWWTLDGTQALPWVRRGGTQRFVVSGRGIEESPWRARISLRLYDDHEDDHLDPRASVKLDGWSGISLLPIYSDLTQPYEVTPPPGTTGVRLAYLTTSHGGGGNGGCAEFCDIESTVSVNGVPHEHVWEQLDTWDCAARVGEGVTPNQWGTWYFDRASWCPGFTGELWQADLTDAFDLDGPNRVTLAATQSRAFPLTGGFPGQPWLVFLGGDGSPTVAPAPRDTCTNLSATLYDFEDTFPDFGPVLDAWSALPSDDPERTAASGVVFGAVDEELVEVDGAWVPALAWPEDTLPFTTATTFSQWFRDVEGVNVSARIDAHAVRSHVDTALIRGHGPAPHLVEPVVSDDFGFGVGRQDRLGSKTVVVEATFTYVPGQQLRFASSDDLWVFVDHHLALERAGFGGHLTPNTGDRRAVTLDLDGLALVPGETYTLHAFLADRGHDGSWSWWAEVPGCQPD